MATFDVWLSTFPKNDRFLLLYGTNANLTTLVISEELKVRKAQGFSVVFIDAATVAAVRTTLMQRSLIGKTLFVLESFDALRSKKFLLPFLSATDDHLIVVSKEKTLDKTPAVKSALKYGGAVKCVEMSDKEAFIRKHLNCSSDAAVLLTRLCAGNILHIIHEIDKLELLGRKVIDADVVTYCCRASWDDFVDDLFNLPKKEIFARYDLNRVPLRHVIALIEARLRLVAFLLAYKNKPFVYKDLASTYGTSPFVIRLVMQGMMKIVTLARLKKWLQALSYVSDKLNSGVTEGLVERFVLLW